MPDMANQSAQFEPVAWWWTRNQIGRDLRGFYEVPKELPPKLLALVSKLAVENNQVQATIGSCVQARLAREVAMNSPLLVALYRVEA
jgi:hypothetical protein